MSKTICSRDALIEAMQLPTNEDILNMSEKDVEEKTRLVAQWADARGIKILSFDPHFLMVEIATGVWNVGPGYWIILEREGEIVLCPDSIFKSEYVVVSNDH